MTRSHLKCMGQSSCLGEESDLAWPQRNAYCGSVGRELAREDVAATVSAMQWEARGRRLVKLREQWSQRSPWSHGWSDGHLSLASRRAGSAEGRRSGEWWAFLGVVVVVVCCCCGRLLLRFLILLVLMLLLDVVVVRGFIRYFAW